MNNNDNLSLRALLAKMPHGEQLMLSVIFVMSGTSFTVGKTIPQGALSLALLVVGGVLAVYVVLHVAMYLALRQFENGPQLMRTGSTAAIFAVLIGATLHALCPYTAYAGYFIEVAGGPTIAQVWERWGRYLLFAFPVCLGITLIIAAIKSWRNGKPVGQLIPISFLAIGAIAFALWISGNVKLSRLVVPGPDLGNVDLIMHVIAPFFIFILVLIIQEFINNNSLVNTVLLCASIFIVIAFHVLTYMLYQMEKLRAGSQFFLETNSATGIGQFVTLTVTGLAVLYLVFGAYRRPST